MPGGAAAYLLDAVLNGQGAWKSLDSQPETMTAQPHLPPYSSDGDYFSKPGMEDIVEGVYAMLHEADPIRFPGQFNSSRA